MADAEMHALLAIRYTLQAADAQIEALMKAKPGLETAQCAHPPEAREDDPSSGMAEVWACTACGYVYDERRMSVAELEELDGR
jgi:hypothetical protein